MLALTPLLARDVLRDLARHKAEVTHRGVYVPCTQLFVFGHFTARVARPGEPFGPPIIAPNRVVNQGLIFALNLIGNHSSPLPWYLAPFVNDVVVSPDWTGSNFVTAAGEFTAYTAASRLPWNSAAATHTAHVTNAADMSHATLEFNPGGPYTVRGCALLTAPAKSSTTGQLFAASRFANDLTGLTGGSKLALEYALSAVDEADV